VVSSDKTCHVGQEVSIGAGCNLQPKIARFNVEGRAHCWSVRRQPQLFYWQTSRQVMHGSVANQDHFDDPPGLGAQP